mmetsp:Transcript_22902/g.40568  ORF Transcript_22902/g.40568 Transcript_22902/m.40568 type:complete len:682 (+) Transcript_22902:108-2153(+)
MRFGAYLEAQRESGWESQYLSYDNLKRIINALASAGQGGEAGDESRFTSLSVKPSMGISGTLDGKALTESDFFAALEADMKKVDNFTHEELSKVRAEAELLEEKLGIGAAKLSELSEDEKVKAAEKAKELGDSFLKIEKFANLNYLGFHKILKKHDKVLPTPCRRFYLTRLHSQRWVKHDYSKLFVELSKVHSTLRGDTSGKNENAGAQNFVRTTTKYWVRTEDVSKVKHIVLQHLPVFQFNLDALQGDSQFCSSVYFDNTQLELYHGRLDKTPDAIAIRFRWYATESPDLVFVERKTHHDSWTGDLSVKERFTLKEAQVMPFLRGEFTVEDKMNEMKSKGKSEADMENCRKLFTEIYQQIESKQLRPTMRTVYNRVAYQIPFDATVRISLDTNLTMIAENPKVGPECATEKRWYRNPNIVLPPTEITRFPHAVLEVKLSLNEGDEEPAWVQSLLTSGMCTQVHKFSKFIHGCATLLPEEVQAFPYWIDDLSIRPSILRSQPVQQRRSSDANVRHTVGTVAYEPIQLMERKSSVSHGPEQVLLGDQDSLTKQLLNKPRKTPMKIEPKVFLANERTLLSWLHMAITLGALAAVLIGYPRHGETPDLALESSGSPTRVLGFILMPISLVFTGYAYMTFSTRGRLLHMRLDGGAFFDMNGPIVLGLVLILALSAIFVNKAAELF